MSQIICYDPRLQLAPGTIIEDAQAPRLASLGVGLLPVDRNRHFSGPVAGHVTRYMGEGWKYDRNQPEGGCHMIMALNREAPVVYWYARVVPVDPKQSAFSGKFKLICDGSGGGLAGGGMRAVDRVESLPQLDKYGGCNVYGKSMLPVSIEGLASFYLHGIGNNVRVLVASISAVAE